MASFKATFSTEQQLNAQFGDNGQTLRTGFGEVIEAAGAVRYDRAQSLTEEEKKRARDNIGADAVIDFENRRLKQIGGQYYFGFAAYNRSVPDFMTLEDIAALNPVLARVRWGSYPFPLYVTGTIKKNANDWSSFIVDLGEFGRFHNDAGTTTIWIKSSFVRDYIMPDNADALTLRAWEQTLDSAVQEQMRSNIGAASADDLTAHTSDTDIHVTDQEKDAWDAKYDKPSGGIPETDLSSSVQQSLDEGVQALSDLNVHKANTGVHFTNATEKADLMQTVDENSHKIDNHTGDTTIHVTSANKTTWNGKYTKPSGGIPESDLDSTTQGKIDGAATSAALTAHTGDTDIHVTAADKSAWSAKYDKPAGGIPASDLADKYAGAAVAGGTADRAASIPFGHVDSTSTATVFTATVPGITELKNGVCMFLMNGVVTSASGFTINVNGLGAKPVYQTMAAATRVTTLWNVNYTMLFVYNEGRVTGGCWDMYYGYNSDTNTLAYNIRVNNSPGVMNKALYRYELMFTLPDGKIEPSNTTSNKPTTYTKALTTESFNPFEPIYYYSTTTTIAADAAASASYSYTQYASLDLRYAFNAGSTLTANKAIYLRCTPQGDCLVKLDGNDCVVQALPSTEDGKVYIYLGKTYSTYQIWLSQNHPIYEYKSGKLKLWDGTI